MDVKEIKTRLIQKLVEVRKTKLYEDHPEFLDDYAPLDFSFNKDNYHISYFHKLEGMEADDVIREYPELTTHFSRISIGTDWIPQDDDTREWIAQILSQYDDYQLKKILKILTELGREYLTEVSFWGYDITSVGIKVKVAAKDARIDHTGFYLDNTLVVDYSDGCLSIDADGVAYVRDYECLIVEFKYEY